MPLTKHTSGVLLLSALLAFLGCDGKSADSSAGGGSSGGDDGTNLPTEGSSAGECSDGADNDQDGDYDCNDSDCAGSPDCSEANTPGGCNDGADNDRDGLFDCDDPDCATDEACGDGVEGNDDGECSDGIDNDNDERIDCDDEDCADAEGCDDYEGDEPGECTDGIDNDGNGDTDCEDAGCAGSPDCEEEPVEDDADGDGVPAAEDCNDDDASMPNDDADCDGILTIDDCDDTDTAQGPSYAGSGCMMRIPASTFDMGCTPGQAPGSYCLGDEYPVMPVTLTHDYFMGRTEVTQAEYETVMGTNPAAFPLCSSICPVESVSWHMAAAYTNALSDAAGLTQCYDCTGAGLATDCTIAMDPYTCDGYRLPTEAEWEGAARCGEDLLFAGSDDATEVGWYSDNSGETTHPSGILAPNACGLYDMSGNVSEWTQDLYDWTYYSSDGRTDPTGATTGTNRVYRGGRWIDRVRYVRVASRRNDGPENAYYVVGFRVARTAL